MKKKKLVECLHSQCNETTEVVLWNGVVGDYQDIGEVRLIDLVRMTKSYWMETLRLEAIRTKYLQTKQPPDWDYQLPEEELRQIEKDYKRSCVWETNAYVSEEDIKLGRYMTKTVAMLVAKPRGIQYNDRIGSIDY